MNLKSIIVPRLAERLLSRNTLDRKRAKVETKRNGAPRVKVFLDPQDPYSRVLEAVLPEFERRYDIEIIRYTVGPPDDAAVPERGALAAYASLDAARLADRAGLEVDFSKRSLSQDTKDADAQLKALGHYQGGMIHYGGEWYWGLDRLHYLEDRLCDMGVAKTDASSIFVPPPVPDGSGESGAVLHWYLSFRSPYTAIVADRVAALAEAYGAELRLRYVLPMVMRSLPVPKAKRRYIVHDTAREAHRLGVPFGRVCDPVGAPVERGYAVLHWAIEHGRGLDFTRAFLRMVWSEGVDAGSDRGLRRIVEAAGLDWTEAHAQLHRDDWRAVAESNRADMMDHGVWGVPSFRIEDKVTWGQDRLWVIEDVLKAATRRPAIG